MAPKQTHENVVHRAREIIGNSVDEPLLQATSTSFSFAQLYAHEYQNAFDKYGLSGCPDMRNCLVRVSLPARVVGLIPLPYQIDLAMYGNEVMDLTMAGLRSM